MASRTVYVDFRGGMMDERMRRRSDLNDYYNSASLIENAVPMRSGGLRLRPGLVPYSNPVNAERILTYIKSVDESYIVALADRKITMLGISTEGSMKEIYTNISTQFSNYEIKDIQYAQNGQMMILAHSNHKPFVLKDSNGIQFGDIVLDTVANVYRVDGNDNETVEYQYDELLNTSNDYPASIAFMANRLWLMSTDRKPYKLWASRPFEPLNFQTVDKVQSVEEGLTVEQYLEAIQGNYEKVEEISPDNEECPGAVKKKTVMSYSSDGYATKTVYYYDENGEKLFSEVVSTVKYTEPKYSWTDVVRDDCAVEQELASDRDESVQWIGSMQNGLYIGTATSEWLIPSDFSAISMSVSKIGSYGTAIGSQCVYGVNSLFYLQSGRKKIRAINISSDGISFSEPSYKCSSILEAGIKEMHWQRIPDPRLYCVLNDGTIAVLSYDSYYGVDAWSVWSFPSLLIKSMTIMDVSDGQDAIVLAEDKETGLRKLYKFSDDAYDDDGTPYTAIVTTNNIEGDGTLPYMKRNFNIYVDSMRTEFKAMSNSGSMLTPRSFDSDLIKLDIYSKSTLDGLRITIESIPGKPFELIALAVEVEVS